MANERHSNGVRTRFDGAGDTWADAHRRHLPPNCYLTDADAFVGMVAFGRNGGDTLFMEYVPDAYENRGKLVRSFGLVAIFERKSNRQAAELSGSVLAAGFLLDICRTYAAVQPVAPRFFFVYGSVAPWELEERDITTGFVTGEPTILENSSSGWGAAWRLLGLSDAQRQLASWLRTKPTEPKKSRPVPQ